MERNLETEFDLPDRLHHPDPIRAAAALELVRLRDATLAGLEASYAAMHQDPRRATREQRAKGQYHGPGNGGVGPTRAVNDFVDRCNAIGAPEGMIADNVVFLMNAVQSLLARAEERRASEEDRRAEEFDRHLAASTAPPPAPEQNATNSQEQQQGVRGDEVSDPPPDTVRSAVSAVAWSSSAGHPPEDFAEADAARPAAATRRSSAGSAIGAAPSASRGAVVPAGPGNERSVSTASTALPSTALVLSSDALEAIQGPRDGSVVSPPRSPLQLPAGSPTPEPRLPLRESHSRDDTRCDTGTGASPPEVGPVVPPSKVLTSSAVVCDRAVGPDDAPSSGAPVEPPPPHPSLEPGFLAAAVQAIYETQRYRQHEAARSHSEPENPHHHHADPGAPVEVTATTTRAVPLLSPPRDRDARPAVRPPREEIDMSAATAGTDTVQRSAAVSPRCQTCATKRGAAGGQARQREHSAPRDRPASRTATPVSQPRSNHPSPHTSRYDVKTRLDTTIASDAPPPPKQRASPLDGLPPSSKAPRREVQETRASMLRRLARRAKIEAQSVGPAVDPWAKPSATQKTSRSSSVTAPPRRGPSASVRAQPKVPQQRSVRRLRPPSPPEDAVFEEPQLLPTASRVDITQNHRLFHPRDAPRRQPTAEVTAAPRTEPINPTGSVDLVDLSSLAGLSPPTPSRTGSTQRADSASPDALRPGMAWPREQAEREQSTRTASASVRQRSMEQVMRDKDAMRRALQEAVQSPQPLLSPADDGSPVAASSWGPQHRQPSHSTPTVRGEHTMDRPAAGPLGSAYVSDRSLSSGRASPGAVFAFGQAHIVPGPVRERALGVHTASPQPSPQPLPHPSAHGPGDHNDVTDTVGVSPSTASVGSDAGEDVFPEDPPPPSAAVAPVRGSSQAQQAQPYNASPSHSAQASQQWLGSLHTVPLTPTPATPASSVGAVVASGRFTRPSHGSDRPTQHGSMDDPMRQALQDQQSSELLLGSPARSLGGDGGSRAPSPQRPASAHGSTPRSWRPLPSHAPGGLSPASRAFLERASKSIGAAQKVKSDA